MLPALIRIVVMVVVQVVMLMSRRGRWGRLQETPINRRRRREGVRPVRAGALEHVWGIVDWRLTVGIRGCGRTSCKQLRIRRLVVGGIPMIPACVQVCAMTLRIHGCQWVVVRHHSTRRAQVVIGWPLVGELSTSLWIIEIIEQMQVNGFPRKSNRVSFPWSWITWRNAINYTLTHTVIPCHLFLLQLILAIIHRRTDRNKFNGIVPRIKKITSRLCRGRVQPPEKPDYGTPRSSGTAKALLSLMPSVARETERKNEEHPVVEQQPIKCQHHAPHHGCLDRSSRLNVVWGRNIDGGELAFGQTEGEPALC